MNSILHSNSFYDGESIKSKRTRQACIYCQHLKLRCSSQMEDGQCERCKKLGKDCKVKERSPRISWIKAYDLQIQQLEKRIEAMEDFIRKKGIPVKNKKDTKKNMQDSINSNDIDKDNREFDLWESLYFGNTPLSPSDLSNFSTQICKTISSESEQSEQMSIISEQECFTPSDFLLSENFEQQSKRDLHLIQDSLLQKFEDPELFHMEYVDPSKVMLQ